jgi:O-antigen/teichoic acid export membrane protein
LSPDNGSTREARDGGRRAGLHLYAWSRLSGPSGRTLATSLMGQAFTLATGIVAARALGVEGRGDLALLWITSLALVTIGGIGLPQATAFFTAKAGTKRDQRAVISTARTTAMPIAFGLTLIYLAGVLVLTAEGSDLRTAGLVNTPLVALILFQSLGVTSLQGLQDFDLFNVTRILPVALYAGAALLLLALGQATLLSLVIASLISFAVATLLTWRKVRLRLEGIGSDRMPRRRLLSFGFRGVLGDMNPVEDTRLDQLIVGFLIDPRALGLYVSAASFMNLPTFIASSLGSVAMPRVAGASEQEAQWKQIRRTTIITFLLIALVLGTLELLLPILIELFFGRDFLGAVPIGRILVVAGAALAMKRLLTSLAKGLGRPGYGSLGEIVNLVGFLGTLGAVALIGDLTAQTVALSVLAGASAGLLFLGIALLRVRLLRLDTDSDC